MIIKNTQFAKTKDVTHLAFGDGDIAVGAMKSKEGKFAGVFFKNIKPGKINRDLPEVKSGLMDEKDTFEAVMSFTEIESMDVVINAMKDARKHLIQIKKEDE